MELEASSVDEATVLSADVCIVGAGPAGLSLAHALEPSGMRVLLLESGIQELNAGDALGDPHHDLQRSRARGVGGSASLWNTFFEGERFAKYVPLDPVDFERREWLPWSGWPFGRATLDPFYQRAHAVCGLGPFDFRAASWSVGGVPLLRPADLRLTQSVYQYGLATRFTDGLPASLRESPGVTLLLGATALDLSRANGGRRVSELRWTAASGRRGTARASTFVLAGGAIENVRLLLLSSFGSAWLGCGFMEHPVDSSLRLSSKDHALAAVPGFYSAHPTALGTVVVGRMTLPAELQRSERLGNASVRLYQESPDLPWPFAALTGKLRGRTYRLLLDLEQGPHPENRIALSESRDAFGQPRAVLHWRWRAEDQANRERIRRFVAAELERGGAGRIELDREQALDPDTHHHAGSTRMHADPTQGVVDENLRVHGTENLFVAGASVFPTAGVANPTLTIVALSLRLAEYLSAGPA